MDILPDFSGPITHCNNAERMNHPQYFRKEVQLFFHCCECHKGFFKVKPNYGCDTMVTCPECTPPLHLQQQGFDKWEKIVGCMYVLFLYNHDTLQMWKLKKIITNGYSYSFPLARLYICNYMNFTCYCLKLAAHHTVHMQMYTVVFSYTNVGCLSQIQIFGHFKIQYCIPIYQPFFSYKHIKHKQICYM